MGVRIGDIKHSLPMDMVIEVTESHTDSDGIIIIDKFELKYMVVHSASELHDVIQKPAADPNSPIASVPRP